jgi:hypothetical protein
LANLEDDAMKLSPFGRDYITDDHKQV